MVEVLTYMAYEIRKLKADVLEVAAAIADAFSPYLRFTIVIQNRSRLSIHDIRLKSHIKRNKYRAIFETRNACSYLNWTQWKEVNKIVNEVLDNFGTPATVTSSNGRYVIRKEFDALVVPKYLTVGSYPCDCEQCRNRIEWP
jgi:hypothetical protein